MVNAKAQITPNLGQAKEYALLSGGTISSINSISCAGKVGAAGSIINISADHKINQNNSGNVTAAIADANGFILFVNGLSGTAINCNLSNHTYGPGVYSTNGHTILNDSLILTGDSSSVFIFKISDSLTVDSNAFILLQGVQSNNIYWVVNASVKIIKPHIFFGNILANNNIYCGLLFDQWISLFSNAGIFLNINQPGYFDNYFSSTNSQANYYLSSQLTCLAGNFNCNEIINSDFNYFTQSPTGLSDILLACPWSNPPVQNQAVGGSSDYFTSAATNASVQVPNNILGSQNDHSSNSNNGAYAGCYAYIGPNIREYIQAPLYHPLKTGIEYYGQFYVSLSGLSQYSVSSMGMYFTPNKVLQPDWILSNSAVINPTSQSIIQSDPNTLLLVEPYWKKISGYFIATGGESYVTIGNFKNDNASGINLTNPMGIYSSYYFVDDPAIVPFEVDAGDDLEICSDGGIVQLGKDNCFSKLNPDPALYTYDWTQISGPITAIFSNTQIYNPTITIPSTTLAPITLVFNVTLHSKLPLPNGYTVTDQVSVNIKVGDCACHTYLIEFPDISSVPNGYVVPPGNYNLNHDLILTNIGNLTFDHCNLSIKQGVQIFLPASLYVQFDHCTFSACSNMWKGFYLRTGSEAWFNTCTISDANIGIYIRENTRLNVYNSVFDNNVVGIQNYQPIGIAPDAFLSLFENTYRCSGTLKPTYPGQPHHGMIPKAGIILTNVIPQNIFHSPAFPIYGDSYFSNLNTGIQMLFSNGEINSCRFENIHNEGFYDQSYMGSAIYLRGFYNERVDVSPGLGQNSGSPTFENCDYGVYTRSINATVHGCIMDNMETGVIATLTGVNRSRTIACNGNTITARKVGINFDKNFTAVNMVAQYNQIHMTDPTGKGINAGESGTGHINLTIEANNITNEQGGVGINLNNIYHPILRYNYLSYPLSVNHLDYVGVSANNCTSFDYSCNWIAGPYASGITTIGLRLSSSQNSSVYCNEYDRTSTGIQLNNNNNNSLIKNNTFHNHIVGLRLSNNPIIGIQDNTANEWLGPFNGLGAIYTHPVFDQFAISNIYKSRFIVHEDFTSGIGYHPNNNLEPDPDATHKWFQYIPGPVPPGCTCNPIPPPNDDIITSFDLDIASDHYYPEEFPNETENMARHALYEKLIRHPELISDPVIQSFYNNFYNSAIQIQAEIMLGLDNLTVYGSWYEDALNLVDSNIIIINDSLALLGNLEQTPLIQNIITSLTNQLNSLFITQTDLMQQIQNIYNGNLNTLITKNNNVIPVELPEINERTVNDIYFNTLDLEDITFNDTQRQELHDIAIQCPYAGGNAVYRARVLYESINPDMVYDDDVACAAWGIFRNANNSSASVDKISNMLIVPNPANNHVVIHYFVPLEYGMCSLIIYDLLGKKIIQQELDAEMTSYQMNTSNLSSGSYIVKLFHNDDLLSHSKLNIIK